MRNAVFSKKEKEAFVFFLDTLKGGYTMENV